MILQKRPALAPVPSSANDTGRCPQPHDERQDESDELRDAFGFPRRAHRRGGVRASRRPKRCRPTWRPRGYLPVETPTLEVMDVLQAGGRLPGTPFKLFDARGDLLAMRPDVTLQIARMCATRLAGQPGPFRFRYMQRVFREAEGPDARRAARDYADGRRAHRPGVPRRPTPRWWACWPNRSSSPAWPTSRSRSHRCRCCARCSSKLRRRAAMAPGGARCVPYVELRHARRADLRRRCAGRSAGVRPGHRQARPVSAAGAPPSPRCARWWPRWAARDGP